MADVAVRGMVQFNLVIYRSLQSTQFIKGHDADVCVAPHQIRRLLCPRLRVLRRSVDNNLRADLQHVHMVLALCIVEHIGNDIVAMTLFICIFVINACFNRISVPVSSVFIVKPWPWDSDPFCNEVLFYFIFRLCQHFALLARRHCVVYLFGLICNRKKLIKLSIRHGRQPNAPLICHCWKREHKDTQKSTNACNHLFDPDQSDSSFFISTPIVFAVFLSIV